MNGMLTTTRHKKHMETSKNHNAYYSVVCWNLDGGDVIFVVFDALLTAYRR